jgi:23S rRNA (cytosine1962-C5)-methyltransferase
MFANRLRKNLRHLARWARRQGLTAYRLYDRDIPEYPFAVDVYGGFAHVQEFPRRQETRREEVLAAVREVLGLEAGQVFLKTHVPHRWGASQYQRQAAGSRTVVVEEQGLKFKVDLAGYLDTGLFLDHRRTRALVRDEARGRRFLNLFAYTGSFTVYAAAGGARATTSVDLSGTYLDWAEENLALNGLQSPRHRFIRADVLEWVEGCEEKFDLVVLDPPSFSTSRRMARRFDVQKDHPRLVRDVRRLLSPGGVLYFSTNFQGFRLDERALEGMAFEDLTPRTIPEDFRRKDIHRCWRAVAAGAAPEPRRPRV